jgi:hypothetical protein
VVFVLDRLLLAVDIIDLVVVELTLDFGSLKLVDFRKDLEWPEEGRYWPIAVSALLA